MGLQRFKLRVANTVISQENANLQTMGTEQLLELFQYEHKQKASDDESLSNSKEESNASNQTSLRSLIEELPDIWETENQYETEYDLTEFINQLQKVKS